MKKTISLCLFVFACFFWQAEAQVLNQPANWPNVNWTVTGNYSTDPLAFEADPTITANFAFDDNAANTAHEDNIAAESPVIDLTAASNAGETWIKVTVDYGYRRLALSFLEFQYYDADAAAWVSWENANIPDNESDIFDNYCSFPKTTYVTNVLDISAFTPTQLSGFQYRIFFDDKPGGSSWVFGFCFDSPTITSETPPACLNPSALTATNLTNTTADLGWTENGSATAWDVYVVTENSPAPIGATAPTDPNVSSNPFNKTGLTSATAYEFYVRADCGSSISNWIGPFPFTTIPVCGEIFYDSGGSSNNYSNGENLIYTITPDMAGNAVSLNFTFVDLEDCCDDLAVYNGAGTNGTPLAADLTAPASFTSTDLSGALTVTFSSDGSINDAGWEAAVTCVPLITCLAPTGLAVSNTQSTTADLSWNAEPNASAGYIWEVYNSGDVPGTDAPVATGSTAAGVTTATASGLTGATYYEAYVQSDCGTTEGQSTLAGPVNFTTRPPNDDLADAIALTVGAPCTGDIYTNTGATAQTGEPVGSCFDDNTPGVPDNSVWFSFTAPVSGEVRISTDIFPGDFEDNEIAVYPAPTTPGDPSTLGSELGCDQDGGNVIGFGFMALLELTGLTPGATYFIQVDGYIGNIGPFCIVVSEIPDFIYENGSWSPGDPSGVATATDNVLVTEGIASLTADTQMNNLRVNPSAYLEIEQVLSVHGDILNNGGLVFLSDGSKLGQLDDMTGSSISGIGNITVQRYYPARRAFRFVSSAVTTTTSIHDNWQEGAGSNTNDPNPGFGTHITGSTTDQQNGFDGTLTGNPSLFLFDNTAQTWGSISNTDMNIIEAGKAYRLMVRGGRNVDLTDNATTPTNTVLRAVGANTGFVVGDYSSTSLGQNAGDFNFIGNPYQAIVDMNSVLANSTNLNPNFYYVWDPTLGGTPTPGQPGGRGAYVTVALPAGTNPSGSQANQFLQPGQAAFVVTATTGAAEIVFGEADKAPFETPTGVFRPSNSTAFINLQLYGGQSFLNGGTASDGLRINFTAGESNVVLSNDAPKLGNLDENICLMNGNNYLSIENRALPVDGEILPLFTDQYRHNNYTFKVETANLGNNLTAYLKDDYLNIQTELPSGFVTIDFSIDESIPASIATDRFSILFSNNLSVEENEIIGFTVYPNPTDGDFFIMAPKLSGKKIQVSIYNILGQQVFSKENEVGPNNQIRVKTNGFETGIYMVKITHQGKTFTDKLIIQ